GEEIKPDPDSFVMLHAGMVTPEFRDPFPLLEVLAELVKQEKLPRKEVRVCFQGGGSYVESAAFTERVRALGVPGLVEVRPRVSYYEALRCLFRAHALVLLQDSEDTRHLIPAKAFEYLRAGRPVVALTNKGATADLIRETGAGYVMDPKEPAEIRAALLNLFSRNGHAPGRPARAPDALKKYERRSQAERLASVLEGL
ncbi:MAG: glycosyltransferase, partial [Candidatus Binatia bacterium]